MPLYEITTDSVFTNVYIIEADSREEACDYVSDPDNAPNFYQRHRHENITDAREIVSGDPTPEDIEMARESVWDRGFN